MSTHQSATLADLRKYIAIATERNDNVFTMTLQAFSTFQFFEARLRLYHASQKAKEPCC